MCDYLSCLTRFAWAAGIGKVFWVRHQRVGRARTSLSSEGSAHVRWAFLFGGSVYLTWWVKCLMKWVLR